MLIRIDAVQGRGAPIVLDMEAASPAEAMTKAEQRGFTVLTVRRAGLTLSSLSTTRRRSSAFDVDVFVDQLRDLVGAGLSVIEAFTTLQRGADPRTEMVLTALVASLRGGLSLSQALASQPCFPALLVSLVEASELTSDLPQALLDYSEHQRRNAEIRHRLISVAIYPLLLMAVGSLVLLFLLFFVMPRFARVFEGMNGDLPWTAQAMVAWSQWLSAHGTWMGAASALLVIAALALWGSADWRSRVLGRLVALTPLNESLRVYALVRWYRATGLLVRGGIPLPQALSISQTLLPTALRSSAQRVQRGIEQGHSPSAGYGQAGMATPVAEQLLRAGERTGDLGAALGRIAQFHEAELTRKLERGMRALEPIVMVLIGLGVGTVVVLMYMPIFELASAIQ
jgi:general secretion pathway protein F